MYNYTEQMYICEYLSILCFIYHYHNSVNIALYDGMTFNGSQVFQTSIFTLTCISTGGPATTVTWTRDSTTVKELRLC